MLQIYKKVEKSIDNPYGVISIKSFEELNNPFLICLSAQDMLDKSVFGMIKAGARAARVNTSDEKAAGFKIEELPLHFLGVKFKRDDNFHHSYEELVDNYFYPFLIGDGNKSLDDIRRLARRINFITYCDGTLTYEQIEKRLEEKFRDAGYLEDDIKSILSEISVVAIATMVNTCDLKANTVTFIDVNDLEIYNSRTDAYQRLLKQKQVKSIHGILKSANNSLYIFSGSGKHSLKEYYLDSCIAKPLISAILTYFLENSIANEHSHELVDISSTEILSRLKKYGDDKKDPLKLLADIDSSLNYGETPKYSDTELMLRIQLDEACKRLQVVNSKVMSIENENQRLKLAINGIKDYSSDITYRQILISAGMWQTSAGEDLLSEKSDKEIRKEYDKFLSDQGPKL